MDSITFEIGDITLKLANGRLRIWATKADRAPDIDLPIDALKRALDTTH